MIGPKFGKSKRLGKTADTDLLSETSDAAAGEQESPLNELSSDAASDVTDLVDSVEAGDADSEASSAANEPTPAITDLAGDLLDETPAVDLESPTRDEQPATAVPDVTDVVEATDTADTL